MRAPSRSKASVAAVDLFCGAGGLTCGMRQAGIKVVAGIDLDPACEYPLTRNNPGTQFVKADIGALCHTNLTTLFPKTGRRVLVGCAPCQPFSPYAHGLAHDRNDKYSLVDRFARLIVECRPEVFSMENTLELRNYEMYSRFVNIVRRAGYKVSSYNVNCASVGVPQARKRLVVFGSIHGKVNLATTKAKRTVVKDAIKNLPPIAAGGSSPKDSLHKCQALSAKNLARVKAAKPGGTWRDWSEDLRAPCHRKRKGASFRSVYGRMKWDDVGPTITTQAFKFGTGRFGHPDQDRAISLREAALLQTFPRYYRFAAPRTPIHFQTVGRLIGNAVPVKLGRLIGVSIIKHLGQFV